jgi:predicted RNA binding protein YcfA (HicA-like mRNA interferase family)
MSVRRFPAIPAITQQFQRSTTLASGLDTDRKMSQFEKLMERLRSGKSLSFSEAQLVMTKLGFTLARVKGSHHIYTHPQIDRPINLQPIGKDVKPYQLRQIRDIIAELGLDD